MKNKESLNNFEQYRQLVETIPNDGRSGIGEDRGRALVKLGGDWLRLWWWAFETEVALPHPEKPDLWQFEWVMPLNYIANHVWRSPHRRFEDSGRYLKYDKTRRQIYYRWQREKNLRDFRDSKKRLLLPYASMVGVLELLAANPKAGTISAEAPLMMQSMMEKKMAQRQKANRAYDMFPNERLAAVFERWAEGGGWLDEVVLAERLMAQVTVYHPGSRVAALRQATEEIGYRPGQDLVAGDAGNRYSFEGFTRLVRGLAGMNGNQFVLDSNLSCL